jgi:catechol 2,3-dioxygenase-like lactoylglutathione lyase family enzyme
MKMRSISAVFCYVKDLDKTAQFYEVLGFNFRERSEDYIKAYLNWFWIEFHVDPAKAGGSTGQFIYVSVDDTDEFYEGVKEKGLKPSEDPHDTAMGRREFTLADPDGYQLVFFKKI